MSTFGRVKRYRTPLVEIDQKIKDLDEAMTTTGFYNTGSTTDALTEIPPTLGEIGDQFLGDFSDPSSLVQNVDYDNVDQLSSDDASSTSSPINSVMDTSNLGLADGVSALAMAANGRPAQGVVYGYIDSNNVFNGVFTIGGMAASGYGINDAIDDGLDWYFEYVHQKTVTTVSWKCYNAPSIWDGLYTPHATGVGPGGNYNLHTNSLLHVKSQNFNNDDGQRKTPSNYTVLNRDDIGNVNFLTIVMGVSTVVLDALVDSFEALSEKIISTVPGFGKPLLQLKDYGDWITKPTDTPTETRLGSNDKNDIITVADEKLSDNFNPDGTPKSEVAGDMTEILVGEAVQTGMNSSTNATNIHGQLPTSNNEVVIHRGQPTNKEGLSSDGKGGFNANDGYDFTSTSQFDIGANDPGVGKIVAELTLNMPEQQIVNAPRQPIVTNFSTNDLGDSLLGRVIKNSGLFSNGKVTESFNISENKSGLPDKYKLLKYIGRESLEKLQSRYPGSDPRLSELNWKMDIMTGASNSYVNKQFPENIEQTSRVKKILARNIKLSDPKTFKTVKQPVTYHKMFGKDPKKKKINESNLKSIFVRPVSRNNLTEGLENYIGMVTFDKVKKYRKPLIEIDEKIDRLDEAMTTTGYYTQVSQNSGQEFIPPTMGDAPQGSVGANDFTWPDQGDGSEAGYVNVPTFTVTDALNRNIARYGYIPGVIYHDGDERRDPDYSNFDGKMPLAMVIDGRALASTRIFYLTNDGLHLVMQIGAYTTPGPYTDLQKAVSQWYLTGRGSQNLTQKTIYIWGGLQFLVGGYYGASQYYPADRSTTTDPVADRGLYAYSMFVPGAPDNPNFATDAGQRSLPPRVTQILNRNDLGDPNYYPGPIAMGPNTLQEMIDEYRNPYTPSYMKQNIIDSLDKWAKPGSRNRRNLQGLGLPLV